MYFINCIIFALTTEMSIFSTQFERKKKGEKGDNYGEQKKNNLSPLRHYNRLEDFMWRKYALKYY